jgi:transposase
VRRYELTDEQYALVADLMPANGRRGGQWNDHRTTLNGILWVLHTGAQWRELPDRYGRWKSVHDRLARWRRDGTFDRLLERLHLRLNERGQIDEDLWCVDATSIRASRSAAGGEKGGGRARGPRPGPQPRRVRDQAAPGHRRQRPTAGGPRVGWPGP